MKKILAIGNSFSEDATKFLHQTAAAAGAETLVVNLYIGGCTLEQHWQNIESGAPAYQYQRNGVLTERYLSIAEAVSEEDWDFIVTQQSSYDSGWRDSYEPFLSLLIGRLRAAAPGAELLLHQTWAYEAGSDHPNFMRYRRDPGEMHRRLTACYREAAAAHGLRLIPCGRAVEFLRRHDPFRVEAGGLSLCRDGYHMSHLYGRYLLALVWAHTLLGIPVAENGYLPQSDALPEQADPAVAARLRELAAEALAEQEGGR